MSTAARLQALRAQVPAILPSLLLCDFAHLADEIKRLEQAGRSLPASRCHGWTLCPEHDLWHDDCRKLVAGCRI